MQRKPAPARADLQQVIARLQVELAAHPIELFCRSRCKRLIGCCKDRAGVCERFVQPEPEELVAQVIVRADVAPTSDACVVAEPMQDPLRLPRDPGRPGVETICGGAVAQEYAKQAGQVVAVP